MDVLVRFGQVGDGEGGIFYEKLGGEAGTLTSGVRTVREALDQVVTKNATAARMLLNGAGEYRVIFLIHVGPGWDNCKSIRDLKGLDTLIAPGDGIFIQLAVCSLFYQVIERDLLAPT